MVVKVDHVVIDELDTAFGETLAGGSSRVEPVNTIIVIKIEHAGTG
jgi:hypothetical protein